MPALFFLLALLCNMGLMALPNAQKIIIYTLHTSASTLKDRNIFVLSDPAYEKEVVTIGVHHVGKREYYEDVRRRLDSLRSEGFVIFYESIGFPNPIDSLKADSIRRKLRKVLGAHVSSDYTDEENKSTTTFSGSAYVPQTLEILGMDFDDPDCIWVDLSTPQLIERYEQTKGEIILTPYDMETPLKAKYRRRKAKDGNSYDRHHLVHVLREEHIVKCVGESDHKKIVLLYGTGHLHRLHKYTRDYLEGKPVEVY